MFYCKARQIYTLWIIIIIILWKVTANRHIITHCVRNNKTNKSASFKIKSFPERQAVLPSSGISYSGPPVSRCSVIGEDVLSCSPKLFSTPQRTNHLHSRPSSARKSATQHSSQIRTAAGQLNIHWSSTSTHSNYCSLSARGENDSLNPDCSSQVQS